MKQILRTKMAFPVALKQQIAWILQSKHQQVLKMHQNEEEGHTWT